MRPLLFFQLWLMRPSFKGLSYCFRLADCNNETYQSQLVIRCSATEVIFRNCLVFKFQTIWLSYRYDFFLLQQKQKQEGEEEKSDLYLALSIRLVSVYFSLPNFSLLRSPYFDDGEANRIKVKTEELFIWI